MTVLDPPGTAHDARARPVTPVEAEVAGALNRLGKGWQVLVRPQLGLEQPDLVAVHPSFGICAIVVKDWTSGTHHKTLDGRIEFRAIDRTAHRVTHPRFEAARCRTTIYDRYFAEPGDPAEPTDAVRAVVVVPKCTTAAANELLAHPAAPSAELAIKVWGGDELHRQVEQIVGRSAAPPDPVSLDRFFAHVVEPHRPSEPPRRLDLTDAQREVADNPTGHRIRRVHGPAGSGKSVALAARAARLAADGKRVLLLTFNVTIANHLRELSAAFSCQYAADPTRITCANFHSFCEQVVDDAAQLGIEIRQPSGMRFADSIVATAIHAYEAGFERRYDAILVDEGQDYTVPWWNLLRAHVLTADGEMLLAADPLQDLYGRSPWYDDVQASAAVFDEPWIDLDGSRRMTRDLTRVAATFAEQHVFGEPARGTCPVLPSEEDSGAHTAATLQSSTTGRWMNINGVSGLGREVGREVVRLLRNQPDLSPREVAFLCEYHHDGEAAVAEIEAAGYPVHHLFSRSPDNPRRGRRYRLWPEADAVKGCTVHSFKGWTVRALVMGIGVECRSKRAAYVSMTRVGADPAGGNSFISIVNADRRLDDFGSTFAALLAPSTSIVNAWDPPQPDQRVG